VLENGKVILARRIETIHYFCVKKENSNPPKILSFFHTKMHMYKNVNPLQSRIGEEGQLQDGMRGSKLLLEDLH
jgi:hypothetical protein